MDSQEFKKNICRICLDESVVLDWNSTLYGYCDITYKDCYYKYTLLECFAEDPFSPMLCQLCLNGIHSAHSLFSKALASYKYFRDTSTFNTQILMGSINFTDDVKYTPAEFETVLVEKTEVEPITEDHFENEKSDEDFNINPVNSKPKRRSKRATAGTTKAEKREKFKNKRSKTLKIENKTEKKIRPANIKTVNSTNNLTSTESSSIKSRRKAKGKITLENETVDQNDNSSMEQGMDMDSTGEEKAKENYLVAETSDNPIAPVEPKVKKKYKEIKKPRMCSICSKILHNKYAVQMHERTHMENRERKETCKVCGLKFYDKRNLYSHKRIHKENREKKHKCEFCNKAFYDKGGLNIHRRIHLGQMIPCSLCAKQFFRQIDLDRHMGTHSATTINSDTKKRSRYFVRCQHCDKSILSTSFKSHTAAHLNEPLMKCSICSKEFFRRGSCVIHVKKVHNKTNEEYNDFIIQFKKNRISHLFLEQKAEIQHANE